MSDDSPSNERIEDFEVLNWVMEVPDYIAQDGITVSASVIPGNLETANACRQNTCPRKHIHTVANVNSMVSANKVAIRSALADVNFQLLPIVVPYRGPLIARAR